MRGVLTALSLAWLSLASSGCAVIGNGVPHAPTFDGGAYMDVGRAILGPPIQVRGSDAHVDDGSVEHLQGVDGNPACTRC